MLISPPFLPERGSLSEAAWLDAAMAAPPFVLAETGAPEGSFPLSLGLAWHNGVHLQAPQAAGAYLPVRAIADGRIVFAHPPTPPNADLLHPLNYNPFRSDPPRPAWTSDGFLVIRHTTEIGAAGTAPTGVAYFSVCMHLASIAANPRRNAPWQAGDEVYRKEALGGPGQVYGHGGQIHFEVCCDEANLRQLMPRAPAWSDPLAPEAPTADGRTDSVFGSVYVYLPIGTPTSAKQPVRHLRAASVGAGAAAPLGKLPQPVWTQIDEDQARSGIESGGPREATDPPEDFPADRLRQPLWVRIDYVNGRAFVHSLDSWGERVGATHEDADYEYDLYATATKRHGSLDDTEKATSSPSGWYELLRFGRNLGPDALPGNAAHWREVPAPTGTGTLWVDLNAQGTCKFSDADFPAVMGWNCFDDDTSPTDQRCDSVRLRTLIRDPSQPESIRDPYALARRLGDPGVRARLRRAVCRFPSEWQRETIVQRYGGLLTQDFRPEDGDEVGAGQWRRFVAHTQAITFAGLPAEFLKADWRFHPREFIGHMRQCRWLSAHELAFLLPRHMFYTTSGIREAIVKPTSIYEISLAAAQTRLAEHNVSLNKTMRKYSIASTLRQAHFFAQVILETAQWRSSTTNPMIELMHEWYFGRYSASNPMTQYYGPFYGRGIMQLTWIGNYLDYGIFRSKSSLPDNTGPYSEKLRAENPRITSNSLHWTGNPNASGSRQIQWAPRYDPNIIANDSYSACDSGGYYWVSKHHSGNININRVCDLPYTTDSAGRINVLVNGGGNGYHERQAYVAYLIHRLGDEVDFSNEIELNTPKGRIKVNLLAPT